ncbi:hypothetical protein B0H13DRAFT_2665973 [Mycena leptocephala]|nr:hypothetical protein B0H13DRAFT_2665973 [Mycena leptocephala]
MPFPSASRTGQIVSLDAGSWKAWRNAALRTARSFSRSFPAILTLSGFVSLLAFASAADGGVTERPDPEEAKSLVPGWRLSKGFDINWEILCDRVMSAAPFSGLGLHLRLNPYHDALSGLRQVPCRRGAPRSQMDKFALRLLRRARSTDSPTPVPPPHVKIEDGAMRERASQSEGGEDKAWGGGMGREAQARARPAGLRTPHASSLHPLPLAVQAAKADRRVNGVKEGRFGENGAWGRGGWVGNTAVGAHTSRGAAHASTLRPSLAYLFILDPSSSMLPKMAPCGYEDSRTAGCGLCDADDRDHEAARDSHPKRTLHLVSLLPCSESSIFVVGIHVKSLINPHVDIPPEMPMFSQLIIDGNIVKQSETMMPEVSGNSWKLKFDCKIPVETTIFSLAVLHKHQGTRLLGHVEIARGEAVTYGEQKKPFTLQINNVNTDGPSLELQAAFSVSESSTAESSGFNRTETRIQRKLSIPLEGQWTKSMPAFRTALELLPELSWLGLSVRDRHHHIVTAGQVVRDAVGTAINACEYGTALEWLEQGRSVIWGQILELRTPVDALKHSHPVLAEKFLLLSRQLEDAGTRDTSLQPGLMDRHWESLHSAGQRYHAAANARNLLLKEIRALHKFESAPSSSLRYFA